MTLMAIAAAVVVAGGAAYGVYRWRKRRGHGVATHVYFIVKGKRTDMETLKVGQLIRPALDVRDRFGNPAAVDGVPAWTPPTSPTHGILEVAADGMSAIFRARGTGQGSFTVTCDADLGEGVRSITGILSYTVLAAEATVINFNVGPAEEDPSA